MIKINRFFIFFSLLLSLVLNLQANIFEKSLDFKEGIIHYTISGSESGKKVIYIKDYGKRRVIYTKTESNFIRHNSIIEKITHITPKWIYELNLKSKRATRSINIKYLLDQNYQKLSPKEREILKANLDTINNETTEKILGYDTIATTTDGVTSYYAKGMDLFLKSQIGILGFHTKTVATDIEKKSVDDKIFELPKDIEFIEDKKRDKKTEKRAKILIDSLLKPQNSVIKKDISAKKEDYQEIIQESIKALENL